ANKNTLKDIKVLIMSYANMKPLSADFHVELTKWIKNGGVLLYYGNDNDPFQNVKEWWNSNGNTFKAPSEHLFGLLGVPSSQSGGIYDVGKGKVYLVRKDPKELIMKANGDEDFMSTVRKAYENDAKAGNLILKNNFVLERGPFLIAAVLDESQSKLPLKLEGTFIDLFNPSLPIVNTKTVQPNTQAYLFDVNKVENRSKPQVLAAAARVTNEVSSKKSYQFIAKSPAKTNNMMRILLANKPQRITANSNGKEISLTKNEWDENSKTLLLGFENFSEGVNVNISW
ncbi:MAG: hypothetical protein EOO93_20590, partial [Pedobacter sp.]